MYKVLAMFKLTDEDLLNNRIRFLRKGFLLYCSISFLAFLNDLSIWSYLAFFQEVWPSTAKVQVTLLVIYFSICTLKSIFDIILFCMALRIFQKYAREFVELNKKKRFIFEILKILGFIAFFVGYILKNTLFPLSSVGTLVSIKGIIDSNLF